VADVSLDPSRRSGLRSRVDGLRERALDTGLALDRRYGDRRAVAIARDVLALDRAVAGTELAGALAYRLFLWFLPFVLVLVAGLGVYADASDQTARGATRPRGRRPTRRASRDWCSSRCRRRPRAARAGTPS
jgi:hypothetical protein